MEKKIKNITEIQTLKAKAFDILVTLEQLQLSFQKQIQPLQKELQDLNAKIAELSK